MLFGGMEGLYAVDFMSGCMALPILQGRRCLIGAAVRLGVVRVPVAS